MKKNNYISMLAVALLPSCATITHGPNEVVVIESTPQGANVQLSNGMNGTTPASFKVKRRDPVHGTISKTGYKTHSFVLLSDFSGSGGTAMAGNILLGGIIGAGVDAGTSAMYKHKPNPLHVTLEKR